MFTKGYKLISLLVVLFVIPYASAWCIIGIGNTCGARATEPHNILGKYFNLDQPQSDNDDIGFFGVRPFKDDSQRSSSPNDVSNLREGDSATILTDGGQEAQIIYTESYDRTVGGEALYFDVDVTNVEVRCPACLDLEGQKIFTAGFDYILDVSLINTGNTPAEKVQMEVTVETLDKVYHYNFNENVLSLSTGAYTIRDLIIPKFGLEGNIVLPEYIYTGLGDSREFPITVTVNLFKTNGVTKPRLQVFRKVERVCTGSGETLRCIDREKFITKEFCPNGNEYSGIYSCNLADPEDQNNLVKDFYAQKLTSQLGADLNLNIP